MVKTVCHILIELSNCSLSNSLIDMSIIKLVFHWGSTKIDWIKRPLLYCSHHRITINKLSGNDATITPKRRCRQKHKLSLGEMRYVGDPRVRWSMMGLVEDYQIEQIVGRTFRHCRR
ncbi:hypothetical protein D3C80_1251460 [compost metagenome]